VACIDALRRQVYDPSRVEVIIINNDPDDAPREVDLTGIRYEVETTPGSYAARNRGIECGTGDILAFTDADCLASTTWLKKAVERIQDEECDVVTGQVRVFPRDENKLTIAEAFDLAVGFFANNNQGPAPSTGVTANMVVTRRCVMALDGFNTRFYSGGDSDFVKRAGRYGFKVCYEPEAVVYHPARRSLKSLAERTRRKTGARMSQKAAEGRLSVLLFLVRPPARSVGRILRTPALNPVSKGKALLAAATIYGVQLWEGVRIGVFRQGAQR
jgi:glycosyltransferase involved in cell wall biosynthesis